MGSHSPWERFPAHQGWKWFTTICNKKIVRDSYCLSVDTDTSCVYFKDKLLYAEWPVFILHKCSFLVITNSNIPLTKVTSSACKPCYAGTEKGTEGDDTKTTVLAGIRKASIWDCNKRNLTITEEKCVITLIGSIVTRNKDHCCSIKHFSYMCIVYEELNSSWYWWSSWYKYLKIQSIWELALYLQET